MALKEIKYRLVVLKPFTVPRSALKYKFNATQQLIDDFIAAHKKHLKEFEESLPK